VILTLAINLFQTEQELITTIIHKQQEHPIGVFICHFVDQAVRHYETAPIQNSSNNSNLPLTSSQTKSS
jgi:hypothetical protein